MLDRIAESNNTNILYRCTKCGQYWQQSSAWNWGGKTYLFKIPETNIEDWQKEQFKSPADMLIYSALMNDYFKKNEFIDTDIKCSIQECNNNSVQRSVLCKKHFIENLQKVRILPKEPLGKMFGPYRFGD